MIDTPLFASLERLQRLKSVRDNLPLLIHQRDVDIVDREGVRDKLDAAFYREQFFFARNVRSWLRADNSNSREEG